MTDTSYIHKARRALASALVDRNAEVSIELLDLYSLLVLTTGTATTLEHVHEAWGVWTARERPDHRSLIPFDQLTPEVQALDAPYRDAIVAAAAFLREG